MKEFIAYLTERIETCKKEIAGMEADGRRDDADFAKVRLNIYDVCRTVTNALTNRPGFGPETVMSRFEGFRTGWGAALENARTHGDERSIVVEETKLTTLDDVIAHFPEGWK